MSKQETVFIFFLFVTGLLLRLPLAEKMQSHWDGPQWSIALFHYSFAQETPAAPGYPLYIALGRVFYLFIHDPHTALVLVSVLASGIGASVFYIAGKIIFNRTVGIIASLLYLSGPTFYFFGLTAYPYSVTSITAALLALFSYASFKKRNGEIALGIIFSIVIGVRPQDVLFLTPLFIFGLYKLPVRKKITALAVFSFSSLLWFTPFVINVGGVKNLINSNSLALQQAVSMIPSKHVLFSNVQAMSKGLFLSFGLGVFFILYYLNYKRAKLGRQRLLLFTVWLIPPILFNAFIRSDHAGHEMEYLSGVLLLISYALWNAFKNKYLLFISVVVIIGFNLFTFFLNRDPGSKKPYVPTSFHYSEIRKNDQKLGGKISFIENHFNGKTTLVIASADLWRPTMYYLHAYRVLELDTLTTRDPAFRDIRRESENFLSKQYRTTDSQVTVPNGISTVIFIDDDARIWVKDNVKRVYSLPANSFVTSMRVFGREKLVFDYGLVKAL